MKFSVVAALACFFVHPAIFYRQVQPAQCSMSSYRVDDQVVVMYGGKCHNAQITDHRSSEDEHQKKYCWLVNLETLGLMWTCEDEMRKSMTDSKIQVTLTPAEYNQFQQWKQNNKVSEN